MQKHIFITPLDTIDQTDVEGIGTLRWEGNKCYKYILHNNGAGDVAPIVGNAAYYYGVSGDAVTGGYENSVVTMDLTDGYLAAGIFQSILGDGDWGWIQIKGAHTFVEAPKAGADGDALTMTGATTDGSLDLSADDKDATVCIATDISAKKVICDFPF